MKKHLFFICPADNLEPIITNDVEESFFYTSLANSVVFNDELVGQINTLIETHGIREITFILSENNSIVTDATNTQKYKA